MGRPSLGVASVRPKGDGVGLLGRSGVHILPDHQEEAKPHCDRRAGAYWSAGCEVALATSAWPRWSIAVAANASIDGTS